MRCQHLVFALGFAEGARRRCPCDDVQLCEPIQAKYDKEIFGFTIASADTTDWDRVTTMAWPPQGGGDDDRLICEAHRHGVRVIYGADTDLPLAGNATEKTAYIRKLVEFVQDNFLDGVTFDYGSPADAGTPVANAYIDIIRQATAVLHVAVPGSQISISVAWSPNGIDGRFYDYKSLADASDLLYVMGYDTRSQIFDRCLAGANCPASIARSGLEQYLARGIPAKKLILGVPWYGYSYPCKDIESNTSKYCELSSKPYRDVNCSDTAGMEVAYKDVMTVARSVDVLTDVMWDETSQTPFFNFRCRDSPVGVCQMWFDNTESLAIKYRIAGELGVRGVGPYQFQDVDWDTSVQSRTEAQAMYTAFDAFLKSTAKPPRRCSTGPGHGTRRVKPPRASCKNYPPEECESKQLVDDPRSRFCAGKHLEVQRDMAICCKGGAPSRQVCDCPDGWAGDSCSQPVCTVEDCGGHGTTTDLDKRDGCRCSCNFGWGGHQCQQPVCTYEDCSGHGTTTDADKGDGCKCTCSFGWGGDDCSRQVCTHEGCSGHGTPTDFDMRYGCKCTCSFGWGGDDCSQPVCTDVDCSGHGTTTDLDKRDGCRCNCNLGWGRYDCSQQVCTYMDCSSHGSTTDLDKRDGCTCTCGFGWGGDDCSRQVCTHEDCSGHGTSTDADKRDGCKCVCSFGWAGDDCSQPAAGKTWCSFGWAGDDCSQPVCTDADCGGHGTTTDLDNRDGCRCTCSFGWGSHDCSQLLAVPVKPPYKAGRAYCEDYPAEECEFGLVDDARSRKCASQHVNVKDDRATCCKVDQGHKAGSAEASAEDPHHYAAPKYQAYSSDYSSCAQLGRCENGAGDSDYEGMICQDDDTHNPATCRMVNGDFACMSCPFGFVHAGDSRRR